MEVVLKRKRRKRKFLIGRQDIIDIPLLGIIDIQAKVDTGAFSSALHCDRLAIRHERDGIWADIEVMAPDGVRRIATLPVIRERYIKNSSGSGEYRFIVQIGVVLFGRKIITEFSLTDRSGMDFPVLLGRKLLHGKFVVDVARKDLSYKFKLGKNTRKRIYMRNKPATP